MRDFHQSWIVRGAAVVFLVLVLLELTYLYSNRLGFRQSVWVPGLDGGSTTLEEPIPTPLGKPLSDKNKPQDGSCSRVEGSDGIVVAIKTGATEANLNIPPLLRTSLRCAPNVHIFSDMEQTIGNHKVQDALKSVSKDVKDGNPDFDLYREQQKLMDPEKVIETLRDMKSPGSSDLAAWTLDKYKNIHIVEGVWQLQPDQDWYIFIDADTYVIWDTLLRWMKRLDPAKVYYLGAKTSIAGSIFAHGGTGYILSRAAMQKIAVRNKGTAARWDPQIRKECCGDLVLAMAIKEYGIELTDASPTLDGHRPDNIPFDVNRWCHYLATMHHITPDLFDIVAEFEENREDQSVSGERFCDTVAVVTDKTSYVQDAVTYIDVFNHFFLGSIPTERGNWDNLSQGDQGLLDARSKEDCKDACRRNKRCTQSLWDGERCIVEVDRVTIGKTRNDSDSKSYYSTWHPDRIQNWVSRQRPCTLKFPGEV